MWLVVSVLWIASVWWFSGGYNVFDQFDAKNPSALLPRLYQAVSVWAFGPPIAVLILGYAVGWIVRGFRSKKAISG